MELVTGFGARLCLLFFSTHLWNSRVGTFGRGVLGPVRTHVLAKMELLHNFNAYLGRTSVLVILPAERSN